MPEIARSVVVLPAPFAPSSDDDLALLDRERDAVQRLHLAVARLDVLELEQRHRSLAGPRYASITAGFACTSAGVPAAIVRPKSSTVTRSEIA